MAKSRHIHRHPELVSGSVRGEEQVKARGEMLKQVQHDNKMSQQLTAKSQSKTKNSQTKTAPLRQNFLPIEGEIKRGSDYVNQNQSNREKRGL